MATRFIGKNIRHRVVRPMKNSTKHRNYATVIEKKEEVIVEETSIVKETPIVEDTAKKKENKKQKKNKEMIDENKLSQLEAITNGEAPKANVKIEKADKGLYERTENSTILLTEDNKMLLND